MVGRDEPAQGAASGPALPPGPPPPPDAPEARRAREAWARIAPSFAAARRRPWPRVVAFLEGLPPGSRVLDAGSGSGRHAAAARERGLACLALDAVRGFAPEVQGDAAALPLRDRCFDAVLLVAVLGTLPLRRDRVHALREARRVLRPGGRLLATAWARWQDDYLRALVRRGPWVRTGPGRVLAPWSLGGEVVQRPYHLATARGLRGELAEAGWSGAAVLLGKERWGRGRLRDNFVVEAVR